jgi:hypothetical protein
VITIYNDSVPEYTHATDVTFRTPNEFSNVVCNHDVCYWKLNMGEMNEDKIWQVLTQPVTVLQAHAPEILEENGKQYITTCGWREKPTPNKGAVSIAELKWKEI